jgi:hypothetical protein
MIFKKHIIIFSKSIVYVIFSVYQVFAEDIRDKDISYDEIKEKISTESEKVYDRLEEYIENNADSSVKEDLMEDLLNFEKNNVEILKKINGNGSS